MKEFVKTAARDFILVDGVYYFRYFNTNPSMMRHCVFAFGIGYRQVNNYLFVQRADGCFLIFYLKGENEVIHGPICGSYSEPASHTSGVHYKSEKGWCTWNPFSEL